MPYKVVQAPDTPTPPPETWSNIKVHSNGHFYVAGIAAQGETAYDTTKTIFTITKRLIEAAGGTMDDIMSMQIFLTDIYENKDVWRARREFFTGDFPCSTLVQVDRVGRPHIDPPMRVEINCTGYIGGSR